MPLGDKLLHVRHLEYKTDLDVLPHSATIVRIAPLDALATGTWNVVFDHGSTWAASCQTLAMSSTAEGATVLVAKSQTALAFRVDAKGAVLSLRPGK